MTWRPDGAAPPPTPRGEVVEFLHGTPVPDPYRWLEDLESPAARAWVRSQNAHTESFLAGDPVREAFAHRLAALYAGERRVPVAFAAGALYLWRHDGLRPQPCLVSQTDPHAPLQTVLDVNELSADGRVSVPMVAPSPDGRWLAYATSVAGSDWLTWHVRDLHTGHDLADRVPWAKLAGAAWSPDGSGFFYGAYPAPGEGASTRPHQDHRLRWHRIGDAADHDVVVCHDAAHRDWVYSPQVSACGRWLVVNAWHGGRHNHVLIARLGAHARGSFTGVPTPSLCLGDTPAAVYDFAGAAGDTLYFRTDAGAPQGRVIALDMGPDGADGPFRPASWREVVPPDPTGPLLQAHRIGDHLALLQAQHGSARIGLVPREGGTPLWLPTPGVGSMAQCLCDSVSTRLCFSFESFTRAPTIIGHDIRSGHSQTWFEAAQAFDPEPFETVLRWATSADGTRVPYHLTQRRDAPADGRTPCLLLGYGGFGLPMQPSFVLNRLAWLEAGGCLASAMVRGGGEYGSVWHEAARGAGRQRAFDDFIAVAEQLVADGTTRPARLAIHGASNGGLLVAACLLQRPDLFGAAVPAVGLLDMLRYHRYTIGAAWAAEYGHPDDAEAFAGLWRYSPVHRTQRGTAYPATLILCADHDDRVAPWHSYKFAAALQHAQGGAAPVLIRIEASAGHGAGRSPASHVAEKADLYAFVWRALGMGDALRSRGEPGSRIDIALKETGAAMTAEPLTRLLRAHRSIRRYREDEPVDDALIDRVLAEAMQGSSSSGNLNMVSVVKTRDPVRKQRLHELHFHQPMVLQAPLVLTFCADTHRTRQWLARHDARPGFADFLSWHIASFDAIILAQTTALALESLGLGICYMGTTLYRMQAIADFLECPEHCLPVTSMVVGWPDEAPSQRDRLPASSWIHDERYRRPDAASLEAGFAAREKNGRARYLAASPEMAALWAEHGITSLAQYYTSKIKYDPDAFAEFSAQMLTLLRQRGFLP